MPDEISLVPRIISEARNNTLVFLEFFDFRTYSLSLSLSFFLFLPIRIDSKSPESRRQLSRRDYTAWRHCNLESSDISSREEALSDTRRQKISLADSLMGALIEESVDRSIWRVRTGEAIDTPRREATRELRKCCESGCEGKNKSTGTDGRNTRAGRRTTNEGKRRDRNFASPTALSALAKLRANPVDRQRAPPNVYEDRWTDSPGGRFTVSPAT